MATRLCSEEATHAQGFSFDSDGTCWVHSLGGNTRRRVGVVLSVTPTVAQCCLTSTAALCRPADEANVETHGFDPSQPPTNLTSWVFPE